MKTGAQIQKEYHQSMREKGMKRVAIYMDDTLWRKAKIQALNEGISLQQLMNATISDYVIRKGIKRD